MKTISNYFKKTALIALVAALALAALPLTNAYASVLVDPTDPPAGETQLSRECLERVWARLQHVYERQGKILERAGQMTEKIQKLIDRMNENGKDTTALQVALDGFEEALKHAHPIYESANGVINSHKGFDDDGKVTDPKEAVETIKELRNKLQEIRQIVAEPGKVMREAIKVFRDVHRSEDTSGVKR